MRDLDPFLRATLITLGFGVLLLAALGFAYVKLWPH